MVNQAWMGEEHRQLRQSQKGLIDPIDIGRNVAGQKLDPKKADDQRCQLVGRNGKEPTHGRAARSVHDGAKIKYPQEKLARSRRRWNSPATSSRDR